VLFVICAVSAVTASVFGLVIARRGEPAAAGAVPVVS
jgi:hypothetical protein